MLALCSKHKLSAKNITLYWGEALVSVSFVYFAERIVKNTLCQQTETGYHLVSRLFSRKKEKNHTQLFM